MIAPSPLISRYHAGILSLQPRDKATMLGVSKKELFSRRIYRKVEVTSQRGEMLLFLTTKIAAVTSPANQKYKVHFSSYLKTKAFVCSQTFTEMTCIRQQNTVNVYLLAIKFNLHHVLALIIPQ